MKTIKLENAHCTAFQNFAPVEFLRGSTDKGKFQIEAYTGAVVDRSWGKLAIEVDGIKAKPALPVLRDHDSSQIVGHSTNTWTERSFFVEGAFSNTTEAAKEVRALAEEGFPWQASIGVAPSEIVSLEPGREMVVNGKILQGPAEVWLESQVFETSFVPCGADGNTSVATFSEPGRKSEGLIKDEWDTDPAVRNEFCGDFESYLAYRENEQKCKTCNSPCRTYDGSDY